MPIIDPPVAAYLKQLATPHDPLLAELTAEGERRDFPIVGPEVGRFLEQLARGIGAKRIFELGSGFGYSTLWFARALPAGGIIHHTDGDASNSEQARTVLRRAGLIDKVIFHVGDARQILRDLADPEPFDIVFCDIDKEQYPDALPIMQARVRLGGFIVIDNLLWSGRVADPAVHDEETEGVRAYTRRIWADDHWLSALLPIRDGVGLHQRLR